MLYSDTTDCGAQRLLHYSVFSHSDTSLFQSSKRFTIGIVLGLGLIIFFRLQSCNLYRRYNQLLVRPLIIHHVISLIKQHYVLKPCTSKYHISSIIEVTICQQCGDQGFINAFVYCVKCLNVAVHRYCLYELPRTFDEFVRWVCEECEHNVLSQPIVQNSEAIRHVPVKVGNHTSTNHKGTSKAKLKTNKKCHESSLSNQLQKVSSEIDSSPESKLRGDSSPIKVNVKSKCSATSLVAVTDSSSHHALDAHASIDCNGQPQSASSSPSPLKLPKDMMSIVEQRFEEQFPKRPCSVRSKPKLVGDSLKVIEETSSSSCIYHKKESKLGKETQLRVQTRSGSCTTSSPRGNGPNISAHDNHKVGQPVIDIIGRPVIDIIWRGCFNIWNKDYGIVDGLVAHLSVKACEKVYKEASLMPPLLRLEMLPKSDVWPNSFKTSEPTDDNIALYFFPADTKSESGFEDLVDLMIHEELAMRAFLSNAELLVFTSKELPLLYWSKPELHIG